MKIITSCVLSVFLIVPCYGENIRGSFLDRMLGHDYGTLCADNPVCFLEGRTMGACCPNDNDEYLSCCNRECSAHTNCNKLYEHCCPTVDNVELHCCDHQPALDAIPSSPPSIAPSNAPTSILSAAPSVSYPPGCPSTASVYASIVKTLPASGTIVFNMTALLPAFDWTVYIEVHARGDYGETSEILEAYSEQDNLIGTLDPAVECSNDFQSQTFTVSSQTFNTWLNDDFVIFTLNASPQVGIFCASNDAYIVLCYETTNHGPSGTPSEAPSSPPSEKPSVTPSANPSVAPSSSPSGRPSTVPSSAPSDTPSASPSVTPYYDYPSATPSLAPTSIDDRTDNGGGGPIVVGGPLCADNPKCNELGLAGECCPTIDGVNLACCYSPPTAASCSTNSVCASSGLAGNCCPTDDGVFLACCGWSEPSN